MQILVAISKTPDTTAKINFKDSGKSLDTSGVQFIANPYDEWYSLVRALEIQEKTGGKVVLVHIGEADGDPVIRKGLAIGADEAIRVDAHPVNAFFTAVQIAEIARKGHYDLIFTGKESIDYNGSEVGSMVAELLNLPFVGLVNHLELDGEKAILKREIEGGTETVSTNLPLVISAAKGLAEQRIPNMKGIMMAKSKPLKVIPPIPVDQGAVVVQFEVPPQKSGVKLFQPDQVSELVRLLNEEAKVI
jgi:electron transfer flavoprotein beta subunit